MTLNPRKWRALFAALALLAACVLAHQVGTAVSEQRAFQPDPPCPKSVEAAFQRLTRTMHAIGEQRRPVCDDLWRRFARTTDLAQAKWIASQARHEGCW